MPPLTLHPEIPGMWYDASRNRYFRITRDNRPPPTTTRHQCPPSKNPSLQHILNCAETGRRTLSPLTPCAALLANAKATRLPNCDLSFNGTPPVKGADANSFVVMRKNHFALFSYPSGTLTDSVTMAVGGHISAFDWSAEKSCLALALGGGNLLSWQLMTCSFGRGIEEGQPAVRAIAATVVAGWPPKCLAMAAGGTFAVTGEKGTEILTWAGSRPRGQSMLRHRDGSCGLVTVFPHAHEVWSGTRGGSVYKWDTRQARGAACTFVPSGRQKSVVDMKMGRGGIFVSCLRNGERNMAMWDYRMIGGRTEPVLVFKGHVNSHKKVHFDVNEEVGLLMSGGDDGRVRVWNARAGGGSAEVGALQGELMESVKMAGWGSGQGCGGPGAWAASSRNTYLVRIGGEHTE
eukprot:GFKZ01005005.1.p1 GENE.GFKZ01005005.1~~GFKZ01005005.1.p1  ORF type:complete len:404 (-),score=25.82 GFKZ01005005.1:527-1738(-)